MQTYEYFYLIIIKVFHHRIGLLSHNFLTKIRILLCNNCIKPISIFISLFKGSYNLAFTNAIYES